MAFPIIFAQLAAGIQPLSDFDTMFSVVGTMGTIFCAASGSNTVALTPAVNMPTVAAYSNYQAFGFVATATSTASVTLNVSGVGALPAYSDTGAPLAAGGLVVGTYNQFIYNSALNSNAGGFQKIGGGALYNTNIQTFTTSGTYTPTPGMLSAVIECWGGGGGGGGVAGTVSVSVGGGGGGAGGYSRKVVTIADIGVSKIVTIGAAGTAGTAGNNAGGNGGDTSVGSLCIGKGATGGSGGATAQLNNGGLGGIPGTGNVVTPGMAGFPGTAINTGPALGGFGGSSNGGAGGRSVLSISGTVVGNVGLGFGAGGSGAAAFDTGSTAVGGAGTAGYVIITELVAS